MGNYFIPFGHNEARDKFEVVGFDRRDGVLCQEHDPKKRKKDNACAPKAVIHQFLCEVIHQVNPVGALAGMAAVGTKDGLTYTAPLASAKARPAGCPEDFTASSDFNSFPLQLLVEMSKTRRDRCDGTWVEAAKNTEHVVGKEPGEWHASWSWRYIPLVRRKPSGL